MSDDGTQTILIAYDGSDGADAAVDKAARILGPHQAIIAVVSSNATAAPFFGTAGVPVGEDAVAELDRAARSAAETIAEKGVARATAAGLAATSEIVEADPVWSAIVDLAEERDVELIAMGSRGLSGLKHVLLGSVSGAVAYHSPRSVLIARP
jgi:nucleotide-binding universal stress UspA family protein